MLFMQYNLDFYRNQMGMHLFHKKTETQPFTIKIHHKLFFQTISIQWGNQVIYK
jgi:hypothetical protein